MAFFEREVTPGGTRTLINPDLRLWFGAIVGLSGNVLLVLANENQVEQQQAGMILAAYGLANTIVALSDSQVAARNNELERETLRQTQDNHLYNWEEVVFPKLYDQATKDADTRALNGVDIRPLM